jgi:hypothetical protein
MRLLQCKFTLSIAVPPQALNYSLNTKSTRDKNKFPLENEPMESDFEWEKVRKNMIGRDRPADCWCVGKDPTHEYVFMIEIQFPNE